MARNNFRISGTDELRRALRKVGELADQALPAAMVDEQEAVISDAKGRTPVDTGVLRSSGTVLPPNVSGSRVEVDAGFGGAAAKYAIPVHERLGAHHNVGEAKFLERAFLERVPNIPKNLATKLERAWRRLSQ